jgi:multidrug resistance protein, MATE family
MDKLFGLTICRYIIWLLPDLFITTLLCPLKAYLSSQGVTLPTLFSSGIALGFHIPLNIFLSRKKGIYGVATAIWLTDISITIMLSAYIFVNEKRKNWVGKATVGGWWDQRAADWVRLLLLSAPCCLTTCLEWWCYEILILLTGRLHDAR